MEFSFVIEIALVIINVCILPYIKVLDPLIFLFFVLFLKISKLQTQVHKSNDNEYTDSGFLL